MSWSVRGAAMQERGADPASQGFREVWEREAILELLEFPKPQGEPVCREKREEE